MKDIMLYYAKCNKTVNQAMYKIIKDKMESPYEVKLEGYYFKHLSDILEHVFITDMIWMNAFSNIESYGLNLTNTVGLVPSYDDKLFTNINDLSVKRAALDDFILAYVEKIDDSVLTKTISRKTRTGEQMEKPFFKSMVHFFNHQTHHRGQVSNVLDNLQIENNYSNMIFLDY